jgi:hypothetical protein
MTKTWDDIRSFTYSTMDPPPNWPSGVRPISQEGMALIGIDPTTNKLFWDGKEIVLQWSIRSELQQ